MENTCSRKRHILKNYLCVCACVCVSESRSSRWCRLDRELSIIPSTWVTWEQLWLEQSHMNYRMSWRRSMWAVCMLKGLFGMFPFTVLYDYMKARGSVCVLLFNTGGKVYQISGYQTSNFNRTKTVNTKHEYQFYTACPSWLQVSRSPYSDVQTILQFKQTNKKKPTSFQMTQRWDFFEEEVFFSSSMFSYKKLKGHVILVNGKRDFSTFNLKNTSVFFH